MNNKPAWHICKKCKVEIDEKDSLLYDEETKLCIYCLGEEEDSKHEMPFSDSVERKV